MLPAKVASHSTGLGASCSLTDLAIYCNEKKRKYLTDVEEKVVVHHGRSNKVYYCLFHNIVT